MPAIDIDVMDAAFSYVRNALGLVLTISPTPESVRTLGDIVGVVARRCNDGDLRRLRIFGHGSSGRQGLGDSVSGQNLLVAPGRGISMDWMNLCTLRHFFGSDGFLELHGCNVGDGTEGKVYVARLCALLGVPVRAGRGTQWTGGGGATHAYEKCYIEANLTPGGQISITEHRAYSNQELLSAWRPARGASR